MVHMPKGELAVESFLQKGCKLTGVKKALVREWYCKSNMFHPAVIVKLSEC